MILIFLIICFWIGLFSCFSSAIPFIGKIIIFLIKYVIAPLFLLFLICDFFKAIQE